MENNKPRFQLSKHIDKKGNIMIPTTYKRVIVANPQRNNNTNRVIHRKGCSGCSRSSNKK